MKFITSPVILLAAIAALAGCSKQQSADERAFLSACYKQHGTAPVCQCSLEKFEAMHPGDTWAIVRKLSAGQLLQEGMTASLACMRGK